MNGQTSLKNTGLYPNIMNLLSGNWGIVVSVIGLALLPFAIAVLNGQPISEVLANEAGNAKFIQGLAIEIFILAAYALSYDLIFGITGLLSFGHAMFFAVGAYLTGVMLKSFEMPLLTTVIIVIFAGIVQALLFAIVLPRVKGITFALVTLGMSSVFYIVIQSRELGTYTGADVGLQGVVTPDYINPSSHRLRFYFLGMAFIFSLYIIYRRFVNSPTGRVCTAIRENEERARMLGFNTFNFKLAALIISSISAALAGLLHALYQPIVSPHFASLSYTVTALLVILIGGVGTLSGALIGAAIYRLLDYGLRSTIGESSSLITGMIYIGIVLFLPYGIVGTWRLRRFNIAQGRKRLSSMITGQQKDIEK